MYVFLLLCLRGKNVDILEMVLRHIIIFCSAFLWCCLQANAQKIEHVYTKLNFETGCNWEQPASEEEAGMGGRAVCRGYSANGKSWLVYFAEGDIRQFVSFGPILDRDALAGGFSQWNSVNDTIEWRLINGVPFATVLRWFIDNVNPDTGSADKKYKGNVLVVTKVAQQDNPYSCVVGYVDARANSNANKIAQDVADNYAMNFECGTDMPRFFGKRSKYSGSPNALAQDQRRN